MGSKQETHLIHIYQKIANDLHISFETIRTHIKKVCRKLGVNNSGGALAKALREILI